MVAVPALASKGLVGVAEGVAAEDIAASMAVNDILIVVTTKQNDE